MALHLIDFYDRGFIQAHPRALFVFGDNMTREGSGGQAFAARHEPNVIGIPTLHTPGVPFTNADWDNPVIQARIAVAFGEIILALEEYHIDVYWPSAGVGTGIANLPVNAPRIFAEIEAFRLGLFLEHPPK
jgi:hypothetical protein